MLKSGPLSNDSVKKALGSFTRLVLDLTEQTEEKASAAQDYGVRALPTLVFLDAKGEVSSTLVGVPEVRELMAAATLAAGG